MRLVDVYWVEVRQTREERDPEIAGETISTDAPQVCSRRMVYLPVTDTQEYDPEADSLYDAAGGTVSSDKFLTLYGTRYLERTYAADLSPGNRMYWILKAAGMQVTDMVRFQDSVQYDSGNVVRFTKTVPSWYTPGKDRLELRRTSNPNLPKDQWTSADSDISGDPEVVDDHFVIHLSSAYSGYYGLWLYHSMSDTDLTGASISEASKSVTVRDTVLFFPMQPITGYDSTKDVLRVYAAGYERRDFAVVPVTYEDSSTADFWCFDYGIGGTIDIRHYWSTDDPREDIRNYSDEQIEDGMRDYEIVTEEVPHFVCAGCIQTGDASVKQTLAMEQKTMADGRICVYPAQNAVTRMTLELECKTEQATYIEEALCHVPLLLTGVKAGAVQARVQPYPTGIGREYILDGAAEIGERFAGSGIFSVRLPLIVETGEDAERFCDLFGILMYYNDAITPEGVSAFRYSPNEKINTLYGRIKPSGLFVRKDVFFTRSDTFSFKYTKSARIAYAPHNYLYQGDTLIASDLAPGTVQEFSLQPGANVLTFYFYDGTDFQVRREDYRLTVYRQAVT